MTRANFRGYTIKKTHLASALFVLLAASVWLYERAPHVSASALQPDVTGPTSLLAGSASAFTASTTDSSGLPVRYGFDWNNDGTVDEWAPSSGYVGGYTTSTTTYSTPGTYAFTVPTYNTLTAHVWGGGAAGGDTTSSPGNGAQSSWKSTVIAGGGTVGHASGGGNPNGAGGTASGGSTNITGNSGAVPNGGSAPGGGGAGGGATVSGSAPGGGGGGQDSTRQGGGSGGYSTITYTAGQLTPGTSVPVIVGAGGTNGGKSSGNGATGSVTIAYTVSGGSAATSTTHSWNTPGTYTFQVLAQNSASANSAWTPYTITVTSPLGSGGSLNGYAWSDTIGWIDLNCSNSGICGSKTFALQFDTDGNLSGYAWSENIGWVSANASDLAGCPIAPCTAKIDPATGAFSGWLKALAANDPQAGGWDGFISFDGTGYGVTRALNGSLSGYAWGDMNVGWVDFSYASTTGSCVVSYSCNGSTIVRLDAACAQTPVTTCEAPSFCSPGSAVCSFPPPTPVATPGFTGKLQARPSLVAKQSTARLYWNIANVSSCTVTGSNGDAFTGTTAGASGTTTRSITSRVDYRLSCTSLDGSPYTEEPPTTINTLPVFHEK